jgi:hypothetical protein
MQIENTRYRVRDVAEHCAVSVATIYRAIESGQLAAVTFGRGTRAFWVSGAAVLADERACAQAAGELLRSTMRGRWWWRHEAGGSGEFTAAQRSLRSWLAAYRSWERTADAAARTASARRAAMVSSSARSTPRVSCHRRSGRAGVLRPRGRISRRWHCAAPRPAPRRPLSSGQRAFGRAWHEAGPAARGRG